MADEIGVLKTAPSSPALFGVNGLKKLTLNLAQQTSSEPNSPSKPQQHSEAAKPTIKSLTIVGILDATDGVTNYLIEVKTSRGDTYDVPRSYSQFRTFYQQLQQKFPQHHLPALPPRTLFKASQADIAQRRSSFESILSDIVASADLRASNVVQQFVNLHSKNHITEFISKITAASSTESSVSQTAGLFGVPLDKTCLNDSGIPVIVSQLVYHLLQQSTPASNDIFYAEENATMSSKMEAVKRYSLKYTSDPLQEKDSTVVATLLKRYFFELPEPVTTFKLFTRWSEVGEISDIKLQTAYLGTLVSLLDPINFDVLNYMCDFFSDLITSSNHRQTAFSIGRAFGPVIFRSMEETQAQSAAFKAINAAMTPATNAMASSLAASGGLANAVAQGITPNAGIASSLVAGLNPGGDVVPALEPPKIPLPKPLEAADPRSIALAALITHSHSIFSNTTTTRRIHKKKRTVIAATLDELIDLLLDPNYHDKDLTYSETFWSCYPYLIDDLALLKALIARFTAQNGTAKWQNRYCSRVLHELISWIRQKSVHLRGNTEFFDTLMKFLEGLTPALNGMKQLEDTVLIHLATKELSVPPNEKFREMVANAANSPALAVDALPKVPKFDFAHHGDPRILAQQFCRLDQELFSIVDPVELCCGRSSEASKTPVFSSVAAYGNRISQWIAYELLVQPNQTERQKVVTFFFDVAFICLEYNNYNAAWAVFGAFNNHSVSRVKEIWDRLSRRDQFRNKELIALFEPRMNFAEYRRNWDKASASTSPAIPIAAFSPKDLLRFEAEDTYIGENTTLIDVDRLRRLQITLQQLRRAVAFTYTFPPAANQTDAAVFSFLLTIPNLSDEALESLSYTIEPLKTPRRSQ